MSFLENIKNHKTNTESWARIVFWFMLVVGLGMLFAIFLAGGFTAWLIIASFLWLIYLFNIKKSTSMGTFVLSKMLIFGMVIILLSVLIVDAAPTGA